MSGRVLFYVQHLLGVGHVARAAAITRGLCEAGLAVTVVQGGEPVPHADFGSAEQVQLPPVRAADLSFKSLLNDRGQPVTDAYLERRSKLLLDFFKAASPAVLLIEHYPFGRRKFARELRPLLDAARGKAAILCSLRDVLVERDDAAKAAHIIEDVERYFDLVLVHGDGTVIPLESTFPAATRIDGRIRYTGYVIDSRPLSVTSGDARAGQDEIIVSTGGGAVGQTLLEAALEARRQSVAKTHAWRLLAGANLPEDVFRRLAAEAPPGTIVERARPDFRSLLAGAALSISQAGYNTVMDLLVARCRNIVIPFAAGAESEQMTRARVLAERGLVTILDEKLLEPERLGHLIERVLASAPPSTTSRAIDLDGVRRTAMIVRAALQERQTAAT